MKPEVVVFGLYIAGSICFLAGSLISLVRAL